MENDPSQQPSPISPPTPSAPPIVPTPAGSNHFKEIKSLVIKVLIGCLIVAAGLAVVAVLVGGFSEIMVRSLTTLVLVAVHAIAALTYIGKTDAEHEEGGLSFFSNVVFAVIVLSFITSVLGTWQILGGDIVWKLYATYFIFLFAALHGNMLHQARGKTSLIDNIVRANYLFMMVVIVLLLPIIYISSGDFASIYYRALAAFGIIDATLTILAVALHRLYLNKHPNDASVLFSANPQLTADGQTVAPQQKIVKRHTNPLLILFAIYLIGQLVVSLIFGLTGKF
jgi:hypothetical protein